MENGNQTRPRENVRVDLIEQSVKHIDALDRARAEFRFRFRELIGNRFGDPIADTSFYVFEKSPDQPIYRAHTDVDGEAIVETLVDIFSQKLTCSLKFDFGNGRRGSSALIFLKDKNPAMQARLDQAALRSRLASSYNSLLSCENSELYLQKFIADYQGKINPKTLERLVRSIKKAQKAKNK